MAVIETIAPIFFIIVFGYLLQQKGLLKAQFIQEANRFVFLFSLPVLIFTGIMKSDIKDIGLINILSVIVPTLVILCLAFILAFAIGLKKGTLGSFVQTTFHGNITYIGLAVLYYMLGDEGLKKGSILIGFLILINNTLAIAILSWTSQKHANIMNSIASVVKTPLIIATFVGIVLLSPRHPCSKADNEKHGNPCEYCPAHGTHHYRSIHVGEYPQELRLNFP